MARRPAHPIEHAARRRAPVHAYEPIATVLGRAENGIAAAQETERSGDHRRRDARNIGADQDRRPKSRAEQPVHARTEIAPALPDRRAMARPDRRGGGSIGGDGEKRAPAPIARQAGDSCTCRVAGKACRRHLADFARKAGFRPSHDGCFKHNDQKRRRRTPLYALSHRGGRDSAPAP
jgi:hypothetical protein